MTLVTNLNLWIQGLEYITHQKKFAFADNLNLVSFIATGLQSLMEIFQQYADIWIINSNPTNLIWFALLTSHILYPLCGLSGFIQYTSEETPPYWVLHSILSQTLWIIQ